ncbi:MAG: histidine phosphatase family protein [Bacillota bacterium]|nr:histidine phosphatase family protein [Bacillota bacterium]
MTRLYITRHGQTEWNIEGRMQGSLNSSLTEVGVKQAIQLGKRLENTNIDIAYSSSSGRALHSAELIVGDRDINIIPVDDLKEMNLGIWEGQTFKVVEEKHKEQFDTFWNTPHLLKEFPGESFEEFKARTVGAAKRIIEDNKGKDVLIVAHALVVKFLMNHFENIPLEKAFDDRIINSTSLSIVEVKGNEYNIVKYNNTEHYEIEL